MAIFDGQIIKINLKGKIFSVYYSYSIEQDDALSSQKKCQDCKEKFLGPIIRVQILKASYKNGRGRDKNIRKETMIFNSLLRIIRDHCLKKEKSIGQGRLCKKCIINAMEHFNNGTLKDIPKKTNSSNGKKPKQAKKGGDGAPAPHVKSPSRNARPGA